jgi:hypothetical protein
MPAKKGFTQFCNKCNTEIGTYGFKKHYNVCIGIGLLGNRSKPVIERKNISGFDRAHPIPDTPCIFCERICNSRSGLKNHERRCPKNPNKIREIITEAGRKKILISLAKGRAKKKIYTKPVGGYRANAGHSKKFKVKDSFGKEVTLQSTYELQCAEILNELGIRWIRPAALFYDGRRYYPDFKLVDFDIFLDPKNSYKAKLDAEKIHKVCEQNNVRVDVLLKEHLTREFMQTYTSSPVRMRD